MMAKKPDPCPCCASGADSYLSEWMYWSVKCSDCRLQTEEVFDTKAEAIAAWNTRPLSARERATRDVLRDARSAIATLEPDALGMDADVNMRYEWPIRDELLSKIDAALAAYQEVP